MDSLSHKAPIGAIPKSKSVYLLKYRKPGGTIQQRIMRSNSAAMRRATRYREQGATVALFHAPIDAWERLI